MPYDIQLYIVCSDVHDTCSVFYSDPVTTIALTMAVVGQRKLSKTASLLVKKLWKPASIKKNKGKSLIIRHFRLMFMYSVWQILVGLLNYRHLSKTTRPFYDGVWPDLLEVLVAILHTVETPGDRGEREGLCMGGQNRRICGRPRALE